MTHAKILVYGAGPLGSLLAARLYRCGHDVRLLSRGQRLQDLRDHGVVLKDFTSGVRTVTPVPVVEALNPDDVYDLILVVMRKHRALDILPVLAANKNTPLVLFLMNNAAGPEAFTNALGDRVLIGFPGAAGFFQGHMVVTLGGAPDRPALVLLGEPDGTIRPRTRQVGLLLTCAGIRTEVRADMDAWLKSHAALIVPLGGALYAAGTDNYRLARTRDAVVLAIRAFREAASVLRVLGIPLTPPRYNLFVRAPEPLTVFVMQRVLADRRMEVALTRHAEAARSDVQHFAGEFMELARKSGAPTPNLDRLLPYFDPAALPIPEGSQQIPLRWGSFLALSGGLLALAALLAVALRRRRKTD
jgi:ketopantoate reductase